MSAHRPSLPSGAWQLRVMPVSPTSLIPTQMSAHSPSRKFRRRQGKVATEASMTLHSHWFSGLLRTLWYCMLGGPGGTDGSHGAGHCHLARCHGERAKQQNAPWELAQQSPAVCPQGPTYSLHPNCSLYHHCRVRPVFSQPFPAHMPDAVTPKTREVL